MNKEKQDRADFVSNAYNLMLPEWVVVEDVAGGTSNIRTKGKTYLPRFPAESASGYNDRLASAVFFNVYNKTVESMTGLIFQKDVALGDDVPEIIKTHCENIDNAGTHLSVFAKELFKESFQGHAFVLVDMPRLEGEIETLMDEQQSGIRPYWVIYKGSDAISWRFANVNGHTILEQIVFREDVVEPIGEFSEQTVRNYRVWRLVEVPETDAPGAATNLRAVWEVYREIEANGQTSLIIATDREGNVLAGVSKLDRIPVTVVYGMQVDQRTPLISRPPLIELAFLNIKHYQKQSDYDNSMHIAGMPILCAKGLQIKEGQKLVIASGNLLQVSEHGNVWYAEPTGAALGAARQSLEDTKKEMALLGLSMLSSESTVAQTATEQVLDSVQETSSLATMARSLQDCLEAALDFHAAYLDLEDGGSVALGVSLRELILQSDEIRMLSDLQMRGQLTLDSLIWNLSKAGKLPPDKKPQAEIDELQNKKDLAINGIAIAGDAAA